MSSHFMTPDIPLYNTSPEIQSFVRGFGRFLSRHLSMLDWIGIIVLVEIFQKLKFVLLIFIFSFNLTTTNSPYHLFVAIFYDRLVQQDSIGTWNFSKNNNNQKLFSSFYFLCSNLSDHFYFSNTPTKRVKTPQPSIRYSIVCHLYCSEASQSI